MDIDQLLQAYLPFPSTAFCTLILAILLWYLYQSRNAPTAVPPGPYSWPIIGNLHQLGKLPHRTLHEFATKYGPITSIKLGSVPAVVISSSQMAKKIFTTHDATFASRPLTALGKYIGYNYKDVLFAPYGDYWREMRKVCVINLLNTKRVESFKYVQQEEVSSMIRSVWEKSAHGTIPVNLSNILSSLASAIMWRILTGSKSHSEDGRGKEIVSQMSSMAGEFVIGDYFPWLDWLDLQGSKRRMQSLHNSFDELVTKIVNEHVHRKSIPNPENQKQNQRSKDIIDVLLEMETTQSQSCMKITPEHINAIVFDLFVGGTHTTSTVLEWAMVLLIKNPGIAKKLQEEVQSVVGIRGKIDDSDLASMEYLQGVIKETLRLYPPAPLLVHESLEACTVGVGAQHYFIPKGTRVMINAWAIGRDPTVWEDPLEFMPERFIDKNTNINIGVQGKDSFGALPFGAGRRGCPGSSMAMATLQLAISHFVNCFDWTIEGGASALDTREAFGSAMLRRVTLFALPKLRLSDSAILSQHYGQ